MAVKSIKFVEEIDRTPDGLARNGELGQGETFTNYRIYRLVHDDQPEQFLKLAITHDSYGTAVHIAQDLRLVAPVEKTIRVWE